jgi:hypothetical protein
MSDYQGVLVVTAADEAYADLLRGLISSLRQRTSVSDVSVIDVGLGEATKDWLRTRSVCIVEGRWMFPFPGQDSAPRYLISMASRPFLPQLFETAKTILWIDSDAWVQDGRTIDMLLAGAAAADIAIVPEIDRSYLIHTDGGTYRRWLEHTYRQTYGDEIIAPGRDAPALLNDGVFAMHRDSPVWSLWQAEVQRLGPTMSFFFAEQIALNYVIYSQRVRPSLLPAICNWLVKFGAPAFDGSSLITPHVPHEKIGIVHLAGLDDKRAQIRVRHRDGSIVMRSPTYSAG